MPGRPCKRYGYEQTGLRNLAALFLGFRIPKGNRTSNWAARQLSPAQLTYAATDAWVCRELYLRFEAAGSAALKIATLAPGIATARARHRRNRMSTVVNHALRQLRAGKLAIGVGLRQARTVDTAQLMKTAGFDWLFIDCEHNSMGTDTAAQIASASLAVGITPIVRVAGKEHWLASRMLDNGAQGVVVPHVESDSEAKRIADHCRFPPIGHRSMGGGLQQLGFAPVPVGEAARIVNEETLVVVMLESPRGIENCEAIAAVPGIDALLIGTNDLCMEMGIPGQFEDPRHPRGVHQGHRGLSQAWQVPGMGGMYTPELLERHIGMGVQLILSGSDFSLLMQAGKARAGLVRGFEKK
jgi:2-keto-3-deoxy-L-rhamnonate aldolase RhmA